MKLAVKEIVVLLIGVSITLSLTIFSQMDLLRFENFNDTFILFFVAIGAIIYIVYKRIGEAEEEIDKVKEDYFKLGERLKIYEKFINLEARLIALEKNGKKK